MKSIIRWSLVLACLLVLKDFLVPVIFASLFVLSFSPLYLKLLKVVKNPKLLSFLLVMALLAVMIVPLTFLGISGIEEAKKLFTSSDLSNLQSLFNLKLFEVRNHIQSFVEKQGWPFDVAAYDSFFEKFLGSLNAQGLRALEVVFKSLPSLLLDLTIFLGSVFYLSQGTISFRSWFLRLWPEDRPEAMRFLHILKTVSSAVVTASVVTAVLQTLIVLGFTLSLQNSYALMFGLFTFLLSFVPIVGTLPVTAFLILSAYLQSQTPSLIAYLVMALLLSGIDNFLKPLLIGNRTRIHPILAFLAALGGLASFGVIGLFLGPIAVGVLLEYLD